MGGRKQQKAYLTMVDFQPTSEHLNILSKHKGIKKGEIDSDILRVGNF